MMLGVLILIIAAYFLLRQQNANVFVQPDKQGNALDILKERYAKGEISADEFNERKRVLEN